MEKSFSLVSLTKKKLKIILRDVSMNKLMIIKKKNECQHKLSSH